MVNLGTSSTLVNLGACSSRTNSTIQLWFIDIVGGDRAEPSQRIMRSPAGVETRTQILCRKQRIRRGRDGANSVRIIVGAGGKIFAMTLGLQVAE
jgi:hypothetical protein